MSYKHTFLDASVFGVTCVRCGHKQICDSQWYNKISLTAEEKQPCTLITLQISRRVFDYMFCNDSWNSCTFHMSAEHTERAGKNGWTLECHLVEQKMFPVAARETWTWFWTISTLNSSYLFDINMSGMSWKRSSRSISVGFASGFRLRVFQYVNLLLFLWLFYCFWGFLCKINCYLNECKAFTAQQWWFVCHASHLECGYGAQCFSPPNSNVMNISDFRRNHSLYS